MQRSSASSKYLIAAMAAPWLLIAFRIYSSATGGDPLRFTTWTGSDGRSHLTIELILMYLGIGMLAIYSSMYFMFGDDPEGKVAMGMGARSVTWWIIAVVAMGHALTACSKAVVANYASMYVVDAVLALLAWFWASRDKLHPMGTSGDDLANLGFNIPWVVIWWRMVSASHEGFPIYFGGQADMAENQFDVAAGMLGIGIFALSINSIWYFFAKDARDKLKAGIGAARINRIYLLHLLTLCTVMLVGNVRTYGWVGAAISLIYVSAWAYFWATQKFVVPEPVGRVTPESGPKEQRAPARRTTAKLTFADICGNDDIKRRLLNAAKEVTGSFGKTGARNGILLHGAPGNGKTVFAEALAGELDVNFLKLTVGDVGSKWIGETTENVRAAFNQARESAPCVLFIDEIDSLIPNRDGLMSGNGASAQDKISTVNEFLTQLVDLRSHKVLLVAATNYLDNLDAAAIREGRFDFKVEITAPDEKARIGLLEAGVKRNVPMAFVAPEVLRSVAQRWVGFSVKRILAVTEELPSYMAEVASSSDSGMAISYDDFMAALRRIQGSKGAEPENVKPMSELILVEETRESLEMLAGRLRDPVRVERLGGSLPTGVLFHGPAGTGKTTVAKSLAKETGYAFMPSTGTDLSKNVAALEKLYAKAQELRPCIIFIDEADDLLKSREFSVNTEATNKLLTLMDGVKDRVRDVIWIAATNHPDQIDPALMRGGRFTEKVEFVLPSGTQLIEHMEQWLRDRKVTLANGLRVEEIATRLGDESVANAEAVLQHAVNRAISRTDSDAVELSVKDLDVGFRTVLYAT